MNARVGAALGIGTVASLGLAGWLLIELRGVREDQLDLKDRIARLKSQLGARPDPTGAQKPSFDWRALERRVERLEGHDNREAGTQTAPAGSANLAMGARPSTRTGDATLDAAGGDPNALPTKLLQAEPFRAGLQDMLKTTMKKSWDERRAKWRERLDQRTQSEIQVFSKQQNLEPGKTENMTQIVQDDRDKRREIMRQFRQNELDSATAKKQVDALATETKGRLVDVLGEGGYQKYQQQRQEQRQVWRSLRRGF